MRFYCHIHKCSFDADASAPIECAQVKHLLGAAPRESSDDDFWEYCCECDNFWVISPDGPGFTNCPACRRPPASRFLCSYCNTVTVEAVTPAKGRNTFLSLQTVALPACPGCQKSESQQVAKHDCEAYDGRFSTSRKQCPFCQQSIEPLVTVPTSVTFVDQSNGPAEARDNQKPNESQSVKIDSTSAPDAVRVCSSCGAPVKATYGFCKSCGVPVSETHKPANSNAQKAPEVNLFGFLSDADSPNKDNELLDIDRLFRYVMGGLVVFVILILAVIALVTLS